MSENPGWRPDGLVSLDDDEDDDDGDDDDDDDDGDNDYHAMRK